MAQLTEHPTVKQFQARETTGNGSARPQTLDHKWLRQVCLEAGADDAGFVEIDRPEIADQKTDIFWLLPKAKTLISFVVRMNRESIRSPARSIANLEFHHTTDETNEVARKIVAALERSGVRALNGGAVGFPMEADRWGSKMWIISHKPVAVAAGLGRMGIHRNVIHRKFGNFILLVVIRDKKVEVSDGHNGTPDFQVTADSNTWLRFLRKEANLVWALVSCGVFINQISYRWSLLAMVTTNGIHIANAKPDGVERGKEGKRQNRANGSASDQHISHGSPRTPNE